jgi:putative flippase GtrA
MRSARFRELARYAVVGGLTTLVDMGVFALTTEFTNLTDDAGNAISIITAILFAYAANKFAVFRSRSAGARDLVLEFVKFVGARLITMALEVAVFRLLTGVVGADRKFVNKSIALILVIISNYILSKFVVFRSRRA